MGTVEKREVLYEQARKEYEAGTQSLFAIAQRHGLNYYNLRNFLRQYHPESQPLHLFNKRKIALKTIVAQQIQEIHSMENQFLRQLEDGRRDI